MSTISRTLRALLLLLIIFSCGKENKKGTSGNKDEEKQQAQESVILTDSVNLKIPEMVARIISFLSHSRISPSYLKILH
ncbi:hypothetical protein [Dyadobacter frigoris]|uniref:Lipoprotein n=1 Tax=Dyadobacter frigoris TaxID=2576211 RepID=A0A4V6BJI3_9BACT|nr:hypothetical protein [Dyadobacter frigoris]TKT94033.1 hypothetical protein FDK13_02150 [Dyadobacter frigoris]